MGIIVRKVNRGPQWREPGHYVVLDDNSEWKIQDITYTASGGVVLHLQELQRFERRLITLCHLTDLVDLISGAKYQEF